MTIPEQVVAEVVREISARMSDPSYGQLAVGSFVQAHPEASQFLSAHMDELGGGENVIHAVFHAQVLARCFEHHLEDAALPPLGFTDLDVVSRGGEPVARLEASQPALNDYLGSNVTEPAMRRLLALIALGLDAVTSRR